MEIRNATLADAAAIWRILEPVIRAGETYALPRDMTEAEALAYWLSPRHEAFVSLIDGVVAGTYYLRANQQGGGSHVANCGYVTAVAFSGRGVARAMCEHSLALAVARGFAAMQFNLVVSTNTRAVHLWQSLGFEIAGRLPKAFDHPQLGPVDAYVMFRDLTDDRH